MNKFFTSLVGGLICFSASAQLHFDGNSDVYYGNSANVNEEVTAEWDVVNSTNMNLELRAKRMAIQEVEGADGNFCFGLLCIAWSTGDYNASSEVVYLGPGEVDSSFKAKYRHHGNQGQAIYEYCIYAAGHMVPDVCQTVNFCVDAECVVSTPSIANLKGEISIAPNPIRELGNISYRFVQKPIQGKMVIYSLMGAKVKEIPLQSKEGVVFLNSNEFTPGMYFCAIEENGAVSQTVKVIFE